MACSVYKYSIKLKGSEKRDLHQAKKEGDKNTRLVIRIFILLATGAGPWLKQPRRWAAANKRCSINARDFWSADRKGWLLWAICPGQDARWLMAPQNART